jgi:hypothetical protein
MKSSRAKFLLGSGSALVLAGCGGAVSSMRPPALAPDSDSILSAGSLNIAYVRKNALRPIARFDKMIRAAYPNGSSIYYYGAYLVQDGTDYALFPASSVLKRDTAGLHAYNDVAKSTRLFSRLATVALIADAGEAIVAPDQTPSPYLQAQIRAGQARLVATVGALSTSRRPSDETDENNGDGDDGSDEIDIVWDGGNQVSSSNNQCTSGGENIGISYTVPTGYSSNVTVTQCINNGTTNICVSFPNQVPGSTHNVSVWVAGSGPPSISMGVVSHGGTQEGVGWSSLGGC